MCQSASEGLAAATVVYTVHKLRTDSAPGPAQLQDMTLHSALQLAASWSSLHIVQFPPNTGIPCMVT